MEHIFGNSCDNPSGTDCAASARSVQFKASPYRSHTFAMAPLLCGFLDPWRSLFQLYGSISYAHQFSITDLTLLL